MIRPYLEHLGPHGLELVLCCVTEHPHGELHALRLEPGAGEGSKDALGHRLHGLGEGVGGGDAAAEERHQAATYCGGKGWGGVFLEPGRTLRYL